MIDQTRPAKSRRVSFDDPCACYEIENNISFSLFFFLFRLEFLGLSYFVMGGVSLAGRGSLDNFI
jgi:hypothetical protein